MQVSQFMHSKPVCVEQTESLTNIAKQMKKGDFGAIIVKNGNNPVGMITDRDIVIRAIANGPDTSKLTAKDIMSKNLIACKANDSLESVANKMKSEKIRRLAVLDEQKNPIGIISLGDLAIAEKGKESGPVFEALEKISQH